jgi:hypothetical protein
LEQTQEYIDKINQYGFDSENLARTMPYLWLVCYDVSIVKAAFECYEQIESPFLFNVVLIRVIEKCVEQGNINTAKEYAKYYRRNGLTELRQMPLFRVRYYYAGNKFDWFLRQCVYLECVNNGTEMDGEFQSKKIKNNY